MKFFLALCFVAAVAQATDVDWSKVKSMDITPPQFKHLLPEGSSASRIVGGQEATLGQFPYQAGLLITVTGGQSFCGGSILNEEWILTAAHCVDATKEVVVILGGHNIVTPEAGQVRITATEFIVHESWNPSTITNDIALIRLPTPIEYNDRIQPTRLPSNAQKSNTFEGLIGTASGWGKPTDSATAVSPVLRWVQNEMITNTRCNTWFFGLVQSTNICMAGTGGRSTCSGDSGGPVVVTDDDGELTQVGLTSFGIALGCELGWPGVFVRITEYLPWLESKTGLSF